MTETKRLEARALEPVAQCLIRYLHVPQIYFDAPWPGPRMQAVDGPALAGPAFVKGPCRHVDLLAIDRAGTGDLHVVKIKHDLPEVLEAIANLMRIPAHYRWVAFYRETVTQHLPEIDLRLLYPESGAGRIGIIEIIRGAGDSPEANIPVITLEEALGKVAEAGDDLWANILLRAERFHGLTRSLVAAFVAKHEPDIAFD